MTKLLWLVKRKYLKSFIFRIKIALNHIFQKILRFKNVSKSLPLTQTIFDFHLHVKFEMKASDIAESL